MSDPLSSAPQGPVLVCGGAGYIGSHCVATLQARGVDVVVVDDLSNGHREAISAPLVEADLKIAPRSARRSPSTRPAP